METLPLEIDSGKTLDDLIGFLGVLREDAAENGTPRLLSISMEASLLDPLAVLETIYESRERSIYIERQSDGFAIAGAEAAVAFTTEGPERFAEAKRRIVDYLEGAVALGDESLPFFGPRFYCAFAFFNEAEAGEVFPPATIFVPNWQIAVVEGRCIATANALIEEGTDIEAVGTRLWKANQKFQSFDYRDAAPEPDHEPLQVLDTAESGGRSGFESAVAEAIDRIAASRFEKVVLARALDLTASKSFHPLRMLNGLRERFSDCFAFSLANGHGQSFIGASPERLIKLESGIVETEALAGSAARGGTAMEDARLGSALLRSPKDRREQKFVFDSICRRLGELGVSVEPSLPVSLKKLRNVQHLQTLIRGKASHSIHILDLVEKLHPTPAVGGVPRDAATEAIHELEPGSRGLYAGAIGYVDHRGEGDFLVGIRSALVESRRARLYAGVGIVEGSTPEREALETDLKFRALMESLL